MISAECDIERFIIFLRKALSKEELSKKEILLGFRGEYKSAEERLLHKGNKEDKSRIQKYWSTLKRMHWFIENGGDLAGIDAHDFKLLRPIIENLVSKKEINTERLKEFDQLMSKFEMS